MRLNRFIHNLNYINGLKYGYTFESRFINPIQNGCCRNAYKHGLLHGVRIKYDEYGTYLNNYHICYYSYGQMIFDKCYQDDYLAESRIYNMDKLNLHLTFRYYTDRRLNRIAVTKYYNY